MYYRHFGLSGAPFQLTPSPKLLFLSKAHRETLTALEWSLEQELSGFSLLIGETGAGKTTLIISLLALGRAPVRVAYLGNPKLGFDGLLRDIARQLGVPAYTDRLDLFRAFDFYLEELGQHERAVVIVDEAQALSDEILDDLRLFSNRDLRGEKRIHFVFAGQPGLLTRLSEPHMRQLNERFGVRVVLNPLEESEARAYVDYRLAAFNGSAEDLFASGALEHLLGRSGGIPRRINVLCHNAMLHAYHAGESRVSLGAARSAALEVESLYAGPARRHTGAAAGTDFLQRHLRALYSRMSGVAPALAAAILAIVGIGSLYFLNAGAPRRQVPVRVDATGIVGDAVIEYPHGNAGAKANPGGDTAAAGAAVPAANDQPRPRQLRVQAGDTLFTIARAYLGSEDEVDRLIKANPQIDDIDHIYPGEMLNLPAAGGARPGGQSARETEASDWQRVTPNAAALSYDGE